MNFINRTLIVLQLLIAIALAPILIVLLLLYRQIVADTLAGLGNALVSGQNAPLTQLACIALAAIAGLIAALFLFLELQRPMIRRFKVQQVMGGEAEITADAIIHRLEQAILQIPDITKVRPGIAAAKKGTLVDLFLEVETSPDVNVPQKTQEVLAAARSVTEEKIGLKVGKVQVRLDHAKKIKNKKDKGDGGRETQQQLPPPPQPQIPS
jgi:hypothetical protein